MGKKGPLWWRESDWLLRGSSAANQILLRHSGPILSDNSLSRLTQIVLSSKPSRWSAITQDFLYNQFLNSKKGKGYKIKFNNSFIFQL